MPIGAFISSREKMSVFTENPKLGHITTFGGHPVIAAAAHATLKELYDRKVMQEVRSKEKLLRETLKHKLIQEVRGSGLMLALMLEKPDQVNFLVHESMKRGLNLFWLLYEPRAVRVTPPLNISDVDLIKGCDIILEVLDRLK